MTLTCKGQAADAEQRRNLELCCQIGAKWHATADQIAGAMATMIQESDAHNYLHDAGQGSVGLYMQRLGFGWGTYAQCTNPSYAIDRFYRTYMPYCRRGEDPITASDHTQRSAYPSAPAQWMAESRRNVAEIMKSAKFDSSTVGGSLSSNLGTKSITRDKPYEFSRGSPGQPENSWDCMGRLAEEVHWNRFMRAGVLWYVSEDWLKKQPPRFALQTGARGVLGMTFDADSRRNAAEMTVTALAKRWSVLPGDVVTVSGQGPGDGLWLVTDTSRKLADDTTQLTLKRPQPKLPEPAPETETKTVSVGGVNMSLGQTSLKGGQPEQAQKVYLAAKAISDQHMPYVWGGGHGAAGTPTSGGYDCSGSCIAALAAANLGYHMGGGTDVSGGMAAHYGAPGQGKYFTVWANWEHVWIQFHGFPAWRFDTSRGGGGSCGTDGPQLRFCARSTATFTPRHWPGL